MIEGHWNFNENVTALVQDYSDLLRKSTSTTDLTITDGQVGKAGVFNGSSSEVNLGNIHDLGGTDIVDIVSKVTRESSQEHVILFKTGHYVLGIDATDKAYFQVTISSTLERITASGTVPISTFTTLVGVYDGVNMFLYQDGVQVATKVQAGNLDASVTDVLIGTSTANFLDGKIEMAEIRTDGLTSTQVVALEANPTGLKITTFANHKLELGDLISESPFGDAKVQGIVTFKEDDLNYRYKPITNKFNFGQTPLRRGNVFDTARQWLAENVVVDDDVIVQIKDRIDQFSKAEIDAQGTKGFRYTKDALRWKAAICPDFEIEPPAQVGQIDNFTPTDIGLATTLFISSTTPVSWTGVLAPSPVKPQLIYIINVGNFNITLRNNSASSLAANRFAVNTNVILSTDDCGYILYDPVRARWRVNKI